MKYTQVMFAILIGVVGGGFYAVCEKITANTAVLESIRASMP